MGLFLLTFLSIYGALHLYMFLKARAALAPGLGLTVLTACFMAVMIVAPIGVRLLERHGWHLASRILAYIGYSWMGFIVIFFGIGVCLDGYNLFMRVLGFLPGSDTTRLMLTGRKAFFLLALVTLVLGLWSLLQVWHIRLDRIALRTPKLPAHMDRLTIVQISDLHLGPMVGERRLASIIRQVRKAQPDLLVCTGDLVDAQMDTLSHLSDMLAELRPPLGKFAVVGNHEFYAGIGQSERFLRAAGFTVLRNQRYLVDNLLTVVGVDDPVGRSRHLDDGTVAATEAALLSDLNLNTYILLLKHRPAVEANLLGRFDLQLSGHTHGGQIFPFTLVTELYYPRQSGLHYLDKGSVLHVSRGAGTWGPPMRLLAPPHITVIELVEQEDDAMGR